MALPEGLSSSGDDRSRASDTLARLRADILCLRLAPGEVISERALEDAYAASRTPIREALLRLTMDGLVARTGRGYAVAPFDLAEIEDLFDFREVVEPAAIRQAAEHADTDELHRIQDSIDRCFERFTPDSWMDVGLDFHVRCAELSRNRCYVETLRNITTRTLRARWLAVRNADGRRVTYEEHNTILAALWARDPDAAGRAVVDHIHSVRQEVLTAIEAARPLLGRRSIVNPKEDDIA